MISSIITIIFFIPAAFLAMRYNMHMFQLNGYKNAEQINWLKKNIRLQWILLFSLLVGIIGLRYHSAIVNAFICFVLAIVTVVYNAMKNMNTKKKFVFTHRVNRMIATIILISTLVILIDIKLFGILSIPGALLIVVAIQLFANIGANIINKPIESIVNKYYINDAKKKLRSVSGIKVIGVTGSYGKTSVKFYLQSLLQEKYNVLVTPESYNTPMGIVKTIRSSLKPTHEIFICEMGARYIGDIKEICDIVHPDYGIITSIGPQHLETFLDMKNIQNTKFELADSIKGKGCLFVNGDNTYIREKAAEYSNTIFYYSERIGDGYYAQDISVSQMGTEFTVIAPNGESERFQMKLIGAHNVINVMGAIAVAHEFGIKLNELIIPIRRIRPVEHRMELRERGLVTIIDDAYNSNPVGSKAAVETLAMFDGLKILITPGMVELGKKEVEYNYQFGIYASECCDYILLVGKKHTEPILEGALSKGFAKEKCKVFNNLEEALSYALSIKSSDHKYILLENDLPDNY